MVPAVLSFYANQRLRSSPMLFLTGKRGARPHLGSSGKSGQRIFGLAQEQSLLEHSNYYYAQGERPLWEVQPLAHHVPLGDIARTLRQEHATAKKADIVVND